MAKIVKHFMTQKQLDDVTETVVALIEQDRSIKADPAELSTTIVDAVAMAVIEGWNETNVADNSATLSRDGETAVTDIKMPNGRRSVQGVSQAKTKAQAALKLVDALTKKYL